MTVSFRSKLFGTYAVLALLMVGLFYGYIHHFLNQRLVEENRRLLLSEAQVVRMQIEELPAGVSVLPVVQRLGSAMHARVTLVAHDGRVLADSGVRADMIPRMENHLARPEVRQALEGGQGSAVRHSETMGTLMLYVAVPYGGAAGPGAVRLALPLSALEKARADLHLGLGVVAGAVLLLALFFSAILSGFISRPLRGMADAAARFGEGNWSLRVPVSGEDEGASLGRVLNRMADRIEVQLQRLREERQQLDTILRSMGEGVVVLDPLGRILLANPAFRRHFGVGDVAVGSRLATVVTNPELLAQYQQHRVNGGDVVAELALAGTGITFAAHWMVLGEHEGTVAVFHDISELKRLESVRRDFVANVSHELRTPVSVIKGAAETLEDGVLAEDPEAASRFVTTIRNHADRLAGLIADLLSLSELESAGFRLELGAVRLPDLVDRVCALLEGKGGDKGVMVRNLVPRNLPMVSGNRQRLEQVLVNLLDNALKYTPDGGSVTVSAAIAGETVRVTVADTGIGIPSRDLPRIFERFYRVDEARSRDQGGTGLGLSIVRHIVQLHGGSVTVESTPGEGSAFSFTLPLSQG